MKNQVTYPGSPTTLLFLSCELPKAATGDSYWAIGVREGLLDKRDSIPIKTIVKELQEVFLVNPNILLSAIGEEMTNRVMAYKFD